MPEPSPELAQAVALADIIRADKAAESPTARSISVTFSGGGKVAIRSYGNITSDYFHSANETWDIPPDWTPEQIAEFRAERRAALKAELEPELDKEFRSRYDQSYMANE